MKRLFVYVILGVCLAGFLAACGGQPVQPTGGETGPQATLAPAETKEAPAGEQPAPDATLKPTQDMTSDVPIMEGALQLQMTGDGSYISYQAEDTTVQDIAKYYEEQLLAMGWEVPNKQSSGFGDSVTLIRRKPGKNLTVTIQPAAGTNNVRVLITVTPAR